MPRTPETNNLFLEKAKNNTYSEIETKFHYCVITDITCKPSAVYTVVSAKAGFDNFETNNSQISGLNVYHQQSIPLYWPKPDLTILAWPVSMVNFFS